jgi:hypothetical protein
MTLRSFLGLSVLLVFAMAWMGEASAQSPRPPCPPIGFFWNCIGTHTWPDGSKYVGEYQLGEFEGQGTYTWPDGSKYVGEYRGGKFDGQGTYTFPDGGKYDGQFRDGQQNGQGTYTWPDGSKYVGEFRDNERTGQGTYTSPDGRKYDDQFRDGKWIVENGDRVKMVESGGIYQVAVLINDTLKLDFIVDSGASDVSIPSDVVLTLIRTGTIKKSDFIGTEKYRLADGSAVESGTFIIRSLKVGDRTVTDVRASIADVNGPLLLGQSFLKRFKSWSQDNAAHELILD